MASIIVVTGPQKGDYYPLGRRTNVIGRSESLPVQILDERVSRKHMKIRFDADSGRYYACDMDSRHGVSVNGTRIHVDAALNDGDYITIGKTSIMFTLKDFPDRESALSHFKKFGERERPTIVNDGNQIPKHEG
jgi:pSer/pThr/pTyr-binding forkhead associated (FHA) protein